MARAGLGNNWKCVFANDFDDIKVKCYEDNWGGEEFVAGDIRMIAPTSIPDNLDLAWASTPCQNFSSAGMGEGLLGSSSSVFTIWWELIKKKYVSGKHPKIIVLENVRGLLKSRSGADFQAVAESFGLNGYRFGVVVVDAIHFLPQSRPRIFLIAIRDGFEVPSHLISTKPINIWHPDDLINSLNKLPDNLQKRHLWWSLPCPPISTLTLCDILEHDVSVWHTFEQTQKLLGAMSHLNISKLRNVASLKSPVVGTLFRRMRPHEGETKSFTEVRLDGVAGCLRASSGGSSRQMLIFIEGETIRTRHMTARESARLMGLSEHYLLPIAKTHAAKVIGDGVAVPVVKFLADSLLLPLALA